MESLSSYLPAFQVRRVMARGGPPAESTAETCQAVFLFVDVTGFTQLTEQLGQRGLAGAEQLSNALNLYFGRLTDLVMARGGNILLFAGDAALALWPCLRDELSTTAAAA